MMTPREMAELIVRTLDEKKADNIKMLATKDITVLADYFVICTASSSTQMKTLSDEVDKVLSENGEAPLRVEGMRNGGWILVDFGCVVVHLFLDEMRKFYNLEHLWSDAPEVDISPLISEN